MPEKLTIFSVQSILDLREKILSQYHKVVRLSDLPIPKEELALWDTDKTKGK